VISVASVLVLLLSIGLLSVRRADAAVSICAGQGICAAIALGMTGSIAAFIALVLNGVAAPLASWRFLDRGQAMLHAKLWVWLAALVLLFIVAGAFGRLGDGVALGSSVVLLGLLTSASGAPAIGLLSAQNGLVVVASSVPDAPLLSSLAAAVPLIPAMLLAHAWLRK
jgi:hypothetical protein